MCLCMHYFKLYVVCRYVLLLCVILVCVIWMLLLVVIVISKNLCDLHLFVYPTTRPCGYAYRYIIGVHVACMYTVRYTLYTVCMYFSRLVGMYITYVCVLCCMFACMTVSVSVHLWAYVCMCVHSRVCCMRINLWLCIYVCDSMCVCMCVEGVDTHCGT